MSLTLYQLIPLLIVGGVFTLYGLSQVARDYWEQSMEDVANIPFTHEDTQ